ncbi:MAG: Ni/Fe-hydrogenase cytochrome b subunit [bacterium]
MNNGSSTHKEFVEDAAPARRPFFTTGVWVLVVLALAGAAVALWRFFFGIGSISNLDDQHPWGLWIGIDVATGVALAAGGFTTAALAHILHRHKYHVITRPALLTALLGYTFVAIGLLVDLGRYYNIWHPIIPYYWQGNSVLFEVGLCVMFYLTVLYIEFLPVVCERFIGAVNLPGALARLNKAVDSMLRSFLSGLNKVMWVFVILGVVLSCLHQSSLGSLMLIAPYKLSPLWYTPILPLLFLLSAIATGYPMVIVESMVAARSFGFRPEMKVLSRLAAITPWLLGIYLALKVGDLFVRGAWVLLFEPTPVTFSFWGEITIGVIIPFILFRIKEVRNDHGLLFTAAFMVVLGVAWNRANVFMIGYNPPHEVKQYVPALGELAVTVGLISTLILVYRFVVNNFPVLARDLVEEARKSPKWRKYGSAAMAILFSVLAPAFLNAPADAQPGDGASVGSYRGPKTIEMETMELDFPYDKYEPVKFRHKFHAQIIKDCSICHHYFERHDDLAREIGVSCEGCHSGKGGRAAYRALSCKTCHSPEFGRSNFERPSLKGAIHRQCIDCHIKSAAGPVTCQECHIKNVPDHAAYISEYNGAKTCEKCHPGKIAEVVNSTHYTLTSKIPMDFLFLDEDATKPAPVGRAGMIQHPSPYWMSIPQLNWLYVVEDDPSTPYLDAVGGCGQCHAGTGLMPYTALGFEIAPEDEVQNVDCLVCHSKSYERKYYASVSGGKLVLSQGGPIIRTIPVVDGVPDYSVYTDAAKDIGHTSAATCNRCHGEKADKHRLIAGDSYAFKRGVGFAQSSDVHAALGLTCSECHYGGGHTYKRKLSSDLMTYSNARLEEGCLDCHRFAHNADSITPMVSKVACTACHAKSTGGIVSIDFSKTVADGENGHKPHTDVATEVASPDWNPEFHWYAAKVKWPDIPIGSKYDGILYPYKKITVNLPVDEQGNQIFLRHSVLAEGGSVEDAIAAGHDDYHKYIAKFHGNPISFGLPPLPGPFAGFEKRSFLYTFSHGISVNGARKCGECHGSSAALDWSSLGMSDPNPQP